MSKNASHPIQWTGTRSAPIHMFTTPELERSINRIRARISELESKNDPVLNNVVTILNNLLSQLVAERAGRIGK